MSDPQSFAQIMESKKSDHEDSEALAGQLLR